MKHLTCSQCETKSSVTLKQSPLCTEHARERLQELKEKKDKLSNEVETLKETYDNLCDKYDVSGYAQIEHQFNIEDREDITEEDVEAVNKAEREYVGKREQLQGVEKLISHLKKQL